MTIPEHTRQPLGPNQERWLKALESGEYKQASGRLRDESDHFCCLGVACEVFGRKAKLRGGEWYYAGEYQVAPPSIQQKLALYDETGDGVLDDFERSLTALNDGGTSFANIAAVIRSDPSVYFKEPR